MSFDNLLIFTLLGVVSISFIIWLLFHWEWLPVVLLVIIWYIPRQAVPNGLLEKYLFVRWLTVILIPMLLFFQIFKIVRKKGCILPPFGIIIPLIILVVLYFISGMVNNSKFIEIIGSILLYIRYPLLFFIFINMELPEDKFNIFIKVFLFLLTLQIPECFYRFFVLGISGDFLSFTLGPWGHFDLGVYSIYAICLIVAYSCIYKFSWLHLTVVVLLFILAIMGEIKTLVISIPIVAFVIVLYYFRNSKGMKRALTFSLPALFIIGVYSITQFWGNIHKTSGNMLQTYLTLIFEVISRPDILINPQGLSYESSRFLGSAFVLDYLKNNSLNLLFGVGPGSLMAGNFLGIPGKIFDIPQYLNQIAVIIGEIGVLGLMIFLWLNINLFRLIIRPNVDAQERTIKIIALAMVGMWIFYVFLGPFYDLVWRHDSPNYFFWSFIAYLFNKNKKSNDLSNLRQ
ncbi:MAG: hypothetical protein ACPL28_07900 [bacterium]